MRKAAARRRVRSDGWAKSGGLAKIRVQPNPDDPAAAEPLRKHLQSLFPEALVWIAPDDPTVPDPIYDDPVASRIRAFDLKLEAMASVIHIELVRDRCLAEALPRVDRLTELERQQRLAFEQLAEVRRSKPSLPASGLPQRLRVERQVLQAELALVESRAERLVLFEQHELKLKQVADMLRRNDSNSPAAQADLLACQAERLQAAIELARQNSEGILSDAEVGFLNERYDSAVQSYQIINALYCVGSSGGTAEIPCKWDSKFAARDRPSPARSGAEKVGWRH